MGHTDGMFFSHYRALVKPKAAQRYWNDQGPIVLMVGNYRTALLGNIRHRCPPVLAGLRGAGFKGWL